MSVVSSFQLPSTCVTARLSEHRSHQLVGVGCADNQARIMRFGDGNVLSTLKGHGNPVTALAFDQSQVSIATGSESGSLRQWDIKTGDTSRIFEGSHKAAVTGLHWSVHGNFLASCSKDTRMRIWDLRKKDCLQSYKEAPASLTAVQFSPSSKVVATGCEDGTIRLYDLVAGKSQKDFIEHRAPITFLAFHPVEFFLAAASADGTISLWDVSEHKLLYQSNKGFIKTPYTAVAFGNDQLVAATKQILRVYDFQHLGDRHARNIETGWEGVSDLQYAPGSNEMISLETRGNTISMSRIPLSSSSSGNGGAVKGTRDYDPAPAPHREEYKQQKVVRQPLPSPRAERAVKKPAEAFDITVNDRKKKMEQMQRARQEDSHAAEMLQDFDPSPGPTKSAPTEIEHIEQLFKVHGTLSLRLERRITHLKIGRSDASNLKSALSHLTRMAQDNTDAGAVLDFINAMQHQRMKERCYIEHLPSILELVIHVISTQKTERALTVAMKTARSMNTKFRSKLDEALRAAQYGGIGVDLNLDGRVERARQAQRAFDDVFMLVGPYATRSDALGDEAKSLISELPRPANL
jgi:katanin p80 WD40 repeat-containing subunit B1